MADENSSRDRVDELTERVAYLESVVREQVARIYQLERQAGLPLRPSKLEPQRPQPIQPTPSGPATVPPPRPAETRPNYQTPTSLAAGTEQPPFDTLRGKPAPPEQARPASRPVTARPPMAAYTTKPEGVPQTTAASPRRGDLEARIGGNWLLRIGVFAIFLGLIFLIQASFQHIPPTGRILAVAAIGLIFLAGGEFLRRRGYATYSAGITGGGIIILYASVYGANQYYGLIGHPPAFVLMALVTTTAVLLAARYNALPIAMLGLAGGFLTPPLLSTGQDNQVGLFGYIALLDLGVLALAYRKHWRSLNYMAFTATVFMFFGWWLQHYNSSKLGTTVQFLTLFFVIFALLAILYNVINKRPVGWADLALVFSNALLYFGASYALLEDQYHGGLGLFAVLMAAFYVGLGVFTYSRDREDRLLLYTFIGLACLFLILAVPIQFDQQWVTMGWAIEGAILTLIGLKVNDRTSRSAATAVFAIAACHWFMIDVPQFAYSAVEEFDPFVNRRALSCAVLVASLAAAAWFYRRYGEKVDDDERSMLSGFYLLAANILAVTVLSLDVNDYFEREKVRALQPDGQAHTFEQATNAQQVALTFLWIMYGAALLVFGLLRRVKLLRAAAIALLMLAALTVLWSEARFYNEPWHTSFYNATFGAMALLVAALAACAWFYSRAEGISENERKFAIFGFILGANLLALIALSMEIAGHYYREGATGQPNGLENAKQFWLSAVWTVYATVTLAIGFRRGSKTVRFFAFALFALATLKILAVDLFYYDASWHNTILNHTFGAFALLVGALAFAAHLYRRADRVDEQERSQALSVITVAANLLAIIALSAEASGYFERQLQSADATNTRDLRLARGLSLSVIWMVYSGAMLTVGILRRNRLLRLMALALLGLTIAKVFFIDLSALERIYRIISFIVLGVILLAVSFLYQKYRQRIAGLIDADDEAALTPE